MKTYSVHIALMYFSLAWITLLSLSCLGLTSIKSQGIQTLAAALMLVANALLWVAFLVPLLASQQFWR